MKIRELVLLTGNLTGQRAFYGETLGLQVITESPEGFTVIVGDSRLRFEPIEMSDSERVGAYHFAFNIPENQMTAAQKWLSDRLPLIADETGQIVFDFQSWQAHSIYAFDPAGNVIELIARHRLPNASTSPFSAAHLLNISEIGIPSAQVPARVEQLTRQLNVPIFDGADSPTFTALGDDHGLLIVVKQGREWYPNTGKIADTWPIRLQIETEAGSSALTI
jgi:catechol-2,3-dioxygenase